jgi:hypothetical protein
MNRRSFIHKTALATTGVFAAPYILPSGRLFARTGTQIAEHVVFCLFSGGVRRLESIDMEGGNLMPNMLNGALTTKFDSILSKKPELYQKQTATCMENEGTLFKNFKSAHISHFNADVAALTGVNPTSSIDYQKHIRYPTIFEYFRKHSGASADEAWWVSTQADPYLTLNYSEDTNYGKQYGANVLQRSLFDNQTLINPCEINKAIYDSNKIPKNAEAELATFFAKNFDKKILLDSIENNEIDSTKFDLFFKSMYSKFDAPQTQLWGLEMYDNASGKNKDRRLDMFNVALAEEVIKTFKPKLLVVDMNRVDVGHTNYTKYCANLNYADYALNHLWQTIQADPTMKNNTVLIVAPEHGRDENKYNDGLLDDFGYAPLQHEDKSPSSMTRDVFCMMVGKGIKMNNKPTAQRYTIDIAPTIAEILGLIIPPEENHMQGESLFNYM